MFERSYILSTLMQSVFSCFYYDCSCFISVYCFHASILVIFCSFSLFCLFISLVATWHLSYICWSAVASIQIYFEGAKFCPSQAAEWSFSSEYQGGWGEGVVVVVVGRGQIWNLVQLEISKVTTEMPYNVQVISGTTERLKLWRGIKILSPQHFYWGDRPSTLPPLPLAHTPRIDATVNVQLIVYFVSDIGHGLWYLWIVLFLCGSKYHSYCDTSSRNTCMWSVEIASRDVH